MGGCLTKKEESRDEKKLVIHTRRELVSSILPWRQTTLDTRCEFATQLDYALRKTMGDECRINGGFLLDPKDGALSILVRYDPPPTISDFQFLTQIRLIFDANGNVIGDSFGLVYDDMSSTYYFTHKKHRQFLLYLNQNKPLYERLLLFPLWEVVDQHVETMPIDLRYLYLKVTPLDVPRRFHQFTHHLFTHEIEQ